jgi:hypothetical protein
MEKPSNVNQAVVGIWTIIILHAIAALLNKWIDVISMTEFGFTVAFYGLFCIFPYKISNGSNAARYAYLVLLVISILLMLAGMGNEMPKIDLILSILLIPFELFIIFRLFQPESSAWFLNK